jgi:hypothetical protein
MTTISRLCTSPELTSVVLISDNTFLPQFNAIYELSGTYSTVDGENTYEYSRWVTFPVGYNGSASNPIEIRFKEFRWEVNQVGTGTLFITPQFNVADAPVCPTVSNVFLAKVLANTPIEITTGDTYEIINITQPVFYKYNFTSGGNPFGPATLAIAGVNYTVARSPGTTELLFGDTNGLVNIPNDTYKTFGPHPIASFAWKIHVVESTPEYNLFVISPATLITPGNTYYYYGDNNQSYCTVDLAEVWDETYNLYGAPNSFNGVPFELDYPEEAVLDWVCNLYLNNNPSLTSFNGVGLNTEMGTLNLSNCGLTSFSYPQLTACDFLNLSNNNLNTSSLQNILQTLNSNNLSGCQINISNNNGNINSNESYVQELLIRNNEITGLVSSGERVVNFIPKLNYSIRTFNSLTQKEKNIYLGLKSKGYNVSPTSIVENNFKDKRS